jgi:hypothetical protein
MSTFRELFLPAAVGAVLSGLGALAVNIYADFLPALMPALQNVGAETYVKIVLLLLLVLGLVAAVAIALYLKAKPYRPRSLWGKAFGFKWSAELDYTKKREEIEIELQWLCPKHKVFFGIKSAEAPETAYYNLWCAKCGRVYEMTSGGAPVYVQEAESIVRRQILSRLRP